jgi:hypothetical protein
MQPDLESIKKLLLKTGLIILSVSAALAIMIVLIGFDSSIMKIIGTTAILGLLCTIVSGNLSRLGTPVIKTLSLVAIISSTIGSILVIYLIWSTGDIFWHFPWKLLWSALIIYVCTATIASTIALKSLNKTIDSWKLVAIVSSAFFWSIIWLDIMGDNMGIIENMWQFVAILFIVMLVSTVGAPILEKIANKPTSDGTNISEAELRAKIESELRAKVEAELRQKIAIENQPTPTESSEPPTVQDPWAQ